MNGTMLRLPSDRAVETINTQALNSGSTRFLFLCFMAVLLYVGVGSKRKDEGGPKSGVHFRPSLPLHPVLPHDLMGR